MSEAFVLLLLPVSLALLPLLIAPGLLFYFDITPKVAALVAATGFALFHWRANAAGLSVLRTCRTGRWFMYLLAAQAASILAATIFSHDSVLSIVGGAWRRTGAVTELAICVFGLLIAARFASAPRTVEITLKLIAASCLLTAIYAIAQFFGLDPFLPAAPYHAGEGIWTIVRPPSTMGNANFLAAYLVYAAVASVTLIRGERNLRNFALAAAAGFGAVAIVLSGTRSGIAGLVVATAILAAGMGKRVRLWILGCGFCTAVLIAILASTPLGLPLKARVRWSREDPLGGGRLLLWRDSFRMLIRRPATGYGPDSFAREFPHFQSFELARLHPDFYQESPHNAYLDAALSAGVPRLAVSLAMLGLGFYAAWGVRNRNPRLALCLTAALAGGTVSAQFSSPVLVTQVYPLTLIAMLCATSCTANRTQTEPARFYKLLVVLAGTAFILFAAALLVSDCLAGSFKRSIAAGRVQEAVVRYHQTMDYSLPRFTVDLYASRCFAKLSLQNLPQRTRALAWQTALEAGRRAVETVEDRQNAFFSLAQLYAEQNDIPGTEENLRLAVQSAPNWFKPHWVLAELLERTRRVPEARKQARIAWALDGGKDPEVVRTWQMLGSPR
jgi:O-antigen ligase